MPLLKMLFSEIPVVLWLGNCVGTSLTGSSFCQNTQRKMRFFPTSPAGSTFKQLNDALKELLQTLLTQNISFCLQFVPFPLNQADALSRVLSDKDSMLAPEPWKELENLFGSQTFDLMVLDSNAQIGCSGSPLPHFTPFPTPGSRGVNVLARDVASQENAYVFPPFILVGPLLRFLGKALFSFTIVIPKLSPLPYWWPLIQARASRFVVLGHKADHDIVLFPSPHRVFFHTSFTLGFVCFQDYQLASLCPFFRFSDLESGSQQLLALIVATLKGHCHGLTCAVAFTLSETCHARPPLCKYR